VTAVGETFVEGRADEMEKENAMEATVSGSQVSN
jgi:hypothetical protein